MSQGRKRWAAVVAGLVLTAAVGYWILTGDQTRTSTRHLAVYFAAFAASLVGARVLEDARGRRLRLALVIAVLWRVGMVFGEPLLSDDIYRSLWEGRIQNHGGNPYAWSHRPDAERWAGLRDSVWHQINHKDYTAIYPPGWQLAARAIDRVSPSVAGMKAFLVACELGALALVAVSLKRRGLPLGRLILWAWSPLALVEIAGSGHNEAFGLLWLAAALFALDAGRPWLSALAAAVGFQAKFLPGIVAVAWARLYLPVHVLSALAVVAILVLPYRAAGWELFMSLERYNSEWRFNDSGFGLLALVLPSPGHAQWAAAVLLVAWVLVLAWRKIEADRSQLLVVAAALALSANVLPWYATWLLPSIVLLRSVPALVFTGTVALAYTVYPGWLADGTWHVGMDIRSLEYGLPLLAAAFAMRKT